MLQFSPEDLLEYFYGEDSQEKHDNIGIALQNNWALNQKMAVIVKAAEQLEKSLHPAPPSVVAQVLAYAAIQQTSVG